MGSIQVITEEKHIRLFFKAENGDGHYTVTGLPIAEIEFDTPTDVAMWFLCKSHGPSWVSKRRRRIKHGDAFSIGEQLFEFVPAEQSEPLPGIWGGYGIKEVRNG